jgi:predicted homoserine dehydrogenase-like protein
MNLHRLLQQRVATNRPIRIGIIGAGAFGSAFLAQARLTPGMQVVSIAELDLDKATRVCLSAGWPREAIGTGGSTAQINAGMTKGMVTLTGDSSRDYGEGRCRNPPRLDGPGKRQARGHGQR